MPFMRNAPRWPRGAVGMLFAAGFGLPLFAEAALAQTTMSTPASTAPDPFHELETKYLFGFTEGADIGAEGEQSVEFETTTELGRRGGHYGIVEQEIEYEGVPTQNFGYELSAHMLGYSLHGVEEKPTRKAPISVAFQPSCGISSLAAARDRPSGLPWWPSPNGPASTTQASRSPTSHELSKRSSIPSLSPTDSTVPSI